MNANTTIRLSIVTVCWNDSANVQRTLESLQRQKEKAGWEHVLIDGGSSDETVNWYRTAQFDFPHRVMSEPDHGIFDAMNKSLEIVDGDYVVFMNAGDRYSDDEAVGRILSRIERNPEWGYSKARVVDSCGRQVRPQVGKIPYSRIMHLLGAAKICHQAVIMRVDFIRDLGQFDLRMGNAADYHLLVKAASRVRPITWPEVDVDYLAGGVSAVQNHEQLWRRHRARVDALGLNVLGASFDKCWTALQLARVRLTRFLKPILGPIYLRLLN